MGYIYKITNLINNKIYIGQTRTSLKARMNKHYNRSSKSGAITGVDAAIKKYGRENFTVDCLCVCDNSELNTLEMQYISEYNCTNPDIGYNLTIGGDNSWSYLGLDEKDVISKYNELKSIKRVAKYFVCSTATISDILHKNNIKLFKPTGNVDNLKISWGKGSPHKKVKLVELDLEFDSIKSCAEWLISHNYCSVKVPKYVCKSLCRILKGKTSAKKYHGQTIVYC